MFKTDQRIEQRGAECTASWKEGGTKQEKKDKQEQPLVSSTKAAKPKCAFCLHVFHHNSTAFIFNLCFYHYCVCPHSLQRSLTLPHPSLSAPSFSRHACLLSQRLHVLGFNQTCLGASPAQHEFWSASQSSWASAQLPHFAGYFTLALPYHTSRVSVLMFRFYLQSGPAHKYCELVCPQSRSILLISPYPSPMCSYFYPSVSLTFFDAYSYFF